MRGQLERHLKAGKPNEVRMHFLEWRLSDGRMVADVTVFPHPCETCVGGDHTHVEINDTRLPAAVLGEIDLPDDAVARINRLIEAQLAVNEATLSLAALYPPGVSH